MKFSRRSVLRATAATFAAPALGAISAVPLARVSAWRKRSRSLEARAVAVRRVEISEGFEHFDYVNPNGAARRPVRQSRLRHLRQFQHVVAGVKGNIAAGTELFTEKH